MARTTATNFTGGLQFPYATAATDVFKKEDVQTLAQAVDQHDHTAGKGLLVNTTPANASITNAKLGPDVARANLLTNGGFEIWQRGNGAFATNGIVSADRWILQLAGTDTMSVSRNTANVDSGSAVCAAVTFTLGTGAGASSLYENLTELLGAFGAAGVLNGLQVSLSVRVRTSTASAVRIAVADQAGTLAVSGFHSGSGAYETLTCTTPTITSASTGLFAKIFHAASCTAYLDNACLVVGSQPANYVPFHPADEMARCRRYYEIIGGAGAYSIDFIGNATSGGQGMNYRIRHSVQKAVSPTVTKQGASWSVTNVAQPTVLAADTDGVTLQGISTTSGFTEYRAAATTDFVTSEANP